MKSQKALLAPTMGLLLIYPAWAKVGFTKEDVDLVKDACLAGGNIDFHFKGDGSISVRNLEGKGELSVGKTDVVVVTVPEQDKRAEFDAIRTCIKEYLKSEPLPTIPDADSGWVDGGSDPHKFCDRN